VILEAMASGVPVIVSPGGGPQHQVTEGQNGFVVGRSEEFADRILALKNDACLLARMRQAARHHACSASWDKVFSHVYATYKMLLRGGISRARGE